MHYVRKNFSFESFWRDIVKTLCHRAQKLKSLYHYGRYWASALPTFFKKATKILGYKLTIPSFYISAFRHIFSHNSQNVYNYMI